MIKLVTGGVQYGVDELHKIPKGIVVMGSCQKMDNDTIAFFGPHSVYSNMHHVSFTVDNQLYKSSEQYTTQEGRIVQR